MINPNSLTRNGDRIHLKNSTPSTATFQEACDGLVAVAARSGLEMESARLEPDANIRGPGLGKRSTNTACSYKVSRDRSGWIGMYHDFSSGLSGSWPVNQIQREGTAEFRQRHYGGKRSVAQRPHTSPPKRSEKQAQAAKRAQRIFSSSRQADHNGSYLRAKGITGANIEGLLQAPGYPLIVPMRDVNSALWNVEIIKRDWRGNRFFKRGLPGGRRDGLHFRIGDVRTNSQTLVFCEGLATGCSINLATGLPVIVCFGAGNLTKVASSLRPRCKSRFIFAADNDKSGAGEIAARAAATVFEGSLVAMPKQSGFDFNDLHQQEDLEAVSEHFKPQLLKTCP